MAQQNQYTLDLGIDINKTITGLENVDDRLSQVDASAKQTGESLTGAFKQVVTSGDIVVKKMNEGAGAVKVFSDAAKQAGVDLNKAFNADNFKTDGITAKVTQFSQTLRDKLGKPFDFKFNIDQAAVKMLVDKLSKAKTEMEGFNLVLNSAKQRLSGLQEGTKEFDDLSKQIKTAETFLIDLKDATEGVEKPTGSLRSEIRKMREELAQMELAGKAGSQEFIELSKRAGDLQDQLEDTSQRVKALASDTKGFDAGISAIRGLAGAFATAQGAMALFGDQNEDLQKTIAKVQGAMALLQGAQEIANVLNKDSALSIYLQTLAHRSNTTAIVAETAAVEGEAAATGVATVATRAWTAALLANPIVALVAVIVAAATAVYAFAKSQKEAEVSAEAFNEELEREKNLISEELALLENRQKFREARASLERKNQSELSKIALDGLRAQKVINKLELEDLQQKISHLHSSDEDYAKNKKALDDAFIENEKKRQQLFYAIAAQELLTEKQVIDDRVKLEQGFLQERQRHAQVEIEINQRTKNFLNQIQAAKIAQLEEGERKEIALLNQGLREKIQNLDAEQKEKLNSLKNEKSNLTLELQVADENEKKIISSKIANLNTEIKLTEANGKQIKALELAFTEQTEKEKAEIRKKYAEQRADIEYDVAIKLLNIEKETAKQREAIITLTAQHEVDVIERTNQAREVKDLQQDAIRKKRDKDIADANLDFKLQEIEIEKTSNENLLMEQKHFFDRSRDGQALANALLLKNQLEADQKKLDALRKAGKDEGDQAVVNAKNAVLRSTDAYNKAVKDAKPINIWEVFFPGDDKAQKNAQAFMKSLDEIGKAVDAYTSLQIANQQRLIDFQNKKISRDDSELEDLKQRLDEEKSLRDKGFANNVDGIRKEISEKNKQREEDLRKADEYQKKMQKIQKAQITAQTILQAVQLATSATNILLQSTAEGGAVGAIIGAISVAAMIGSFIAQKKAAYDAVNNSTTTYGEGGLIGGKSHTEGGQKYYANDASGNVVELEEGEQVIRKSQTKKYYPLLDAINKGQTNGMSDRDLMQLLAKTGVHFQTDETHDEAIRESRAHSAFQVSNTVVVPSGAGASSERLDSIDNNVRKLVEQGDNRETIYQDGDYTIIKRGNSITRIKKS